jgi:hypothetical protein
MGFFRALRKGEIFQPVPSDRARVSDREHREADEM